MMILLIIHCYHYTKQHRQTDIYFADYNVIDAKLQHILSQKK